MNAVKVAFGEQEIVVRLGENTTEAARLAEEARVAALVAQAFGEFYASIADGLANTSDGEGFAVDNGDGTATVYENDGGSEVSQRDIIIDPSHKGTSGLLGYEQGGGFEGGTIGGRLNDLPQSLKAAPYYASAAGDDTSALTALAASSDDEIRLEINQPLRLSSQVTFTDKQLSITGAGSAASKVICTDTGGIKFVSTATTETVASQHRFTVNGVTFEQQSSPAAGAGATAIEGIWNFPGSGSIERFVARDLTITGGGAGKWWNKGIRLVDAPHVRMSDIKIYNQDGHQTCQSDAAIEMVRDKASNVTGFHLSNFWLGRYVNGLLVSQEDATAGAGTVEGHYLTNGEMVNVAYGIHEDNEADASVYYDTISLAAMHINASRAGFKAGRVRGLSLNGCQWFAQNFGDSSPAPLEAMFNILLQLDGLRGGGNTFTRSDTITDDAPCFLLPDAASLNWARVEGNQLANWRNVAEVQTGGSLTELADKLYLGKNTLIATPHLTDYGFRGDKVTIGGNISVATGTVVNFGHTFASVPAVTLICRNLYVSNFRIDSLGTTGFTLTHDGSGTQSFSWMAVGI